MRIVLYEPDIPQNTGTILRLAACLGLAVDIIEPAGFPVTDRAFRRAGMDYLDRVSITRHGSFKDFDDWRRRAGLKLVVLTTAAERSYLDHTFAADQVLLFGRESAGVSQACIRRPTRAFVSLSLRACVHSTWRWRWPWWRRSAAADGRISCLSQVKPAPAPCARKPRRL